MSTSAWQRLAPQTPRTGAGAGAVQPDLDTHLADIETYLDEPSTRAALDAAEAAGEYPREVLTGLRVRHLAELLVPDRATSPHLGALNMLTARRSGSLAITVGVNALALLPVYLGGTHAQCEFVTRRIRAGQAAALLLSELEHGSNLLRTECRAWAEDDDYRITGEKHLINGGTEHDLLVTMVRTRRSPADRPLAVLRDFSLYLVERDGTVSALPRWRTLPTRSADISGVRFTGTKVPRNALIGREGEGFPLIQKTLKLSHAGIGALASGAVSGALELTLEHARTRDVYGGPIIGLGAINEHCTRMAALDVVIAALAVKASWTANRYGPAAGYFAAAAKYACCRLAEEAVTEGRHVLGARALLEDLPYARFVRDVLLYGVFDGTSHVMLNDLSQYLPGFAASKAGSGGGDVMHAVYATKPRPIRSVVAHPWQPFAPPLSARCADVLALSEDPAAARVAALAGQLDGMVRAALAAGVWDADQALRFEAAAILAELEALLAAVELTVPEVRSRCGQRPVEQSDVDAARYAVSWWGDRLAGRLDSLAAMIGARAGRGTDGFRDPTPADRLRAHVAGLAHPAAMDGASAHPR